MRIDVVTLFPELFTSFFEVSFVGKARKAGILATRTRSPRDFGLGNHKSIDDTPYGGGSGMVMRVDCLMQTIESLDAEAPDEPRAHRILLTPSGHPYRQAKAVELSKKPAIMLICGRYEGFDARINRYIDDEISLGDFVMIGGEIAAMALIESTVRLIPGVLGNEESTREESHSAETGGLLEYPQYTRPLSYCGDEVPAVLRGGNHAAIQAWRLEQARALTGARRPELLAAYDEAHPPPRPKNRRKKRAPTPAAGPLPSPAGGPAEAASEAVSGRDPDPDPNPEPQPAREEG